MAGKSPLPDLNLLRREARTETDPQQRVVKVQAYVAALEAQVAERFPGVVAPAPAAAPAPAPVAKDAVAGYIRGQMAAGANGNALIAKVADFARTDRAGAIRAITAVMNERGDNVAKIGRPKRGESAYGVGGSKEQFATIDRVIQDKGNGKYLVYDNQGEEFLVRPYPEGDTEGRSAWWIVQ